MPFSFDASALDATVPVLVFSTTQDIVEQGGLAVVRSLGRLGVPVYATVQHRFTPTAVSRYLAGAFDRKTGSRDQLGLLKRLAWIGNQLGRPSILIPTDDLAAALIAEHADLLEDWFLFARPPRDLPRQLANKKKLHSLCEGLGISYPKTVFPGSLEEVQAFIACAEFPVVVKMAEPQRRPKFARSVRIVQSPEELVTVYRQADQVGCSELIFQEYIPHNCGEDWIFHGYVNPKTKCFIGFTGKKLRSYPPFAGSTSLGVSVKNETLRRQTEFLLRSTGYAGILDLDYRLDKRDGQYKLLDFNPRLGANFRMFEDHGGVDVVRALHLDLTGRPVPVSLEAVGRTFIVEPWDIAASFGYMHCGHLTVRTWLRSLKGRRELAWFSRDDAAPFLSLLVHLVLGTIQKLVGLSWAWLSGSSRRAAATNGRNARIVESKDDEQSLLQRS